MATFLPAATGSLLALLGLLIIWAGGVVLFSPDNRVWFLAGVHRHRLDLPGLRYFFGPTTGSRHASKIRAIIRSDLDRRGHHHAGVAGLGLATFVWVAGILLIVVSVASLFSLPKKA